MLVYQRVPTMLYWTHRFFMFPPAWSVVVAPTTVLQRLSSSPRTNPRFVALRIFFEGYIATAANKTETNCVFKQKTCAISKFQRSNVRRKLCNKYSNHQRSYTSPNVTLRLPLAPCAALKKLRGGIVSDLMKGHNWAICLDRICKKNKQSLKQTETSILQTGILSFQPISVNRPLSMFLSQSWRCVTPNTQWCR